MNPTAAQAPHLRTEICHHHQENSTFDVLINIIEKISAIVLGIFSAYVCLELFIPFFFIGIAIGIYSYTQDKKSCDHTHPGSSCAHGLLEQLTGVKLPKIVSLGANLAVTVCHIDHHAAVFVPVVGISLGAWIGKMVAHYAVLIGKAISVYFSKNKLPHNPAFSFQRGMLTYNVL